MYIQSGIGLKATSLKTNDVKVKQTQCVVLKNVGSLPLNSVYFYERESLQKGRAESDSF